MELLKNRMLPAVLLLLLLFLSSGPTTCAAARPAARPEGLPGVADQKRTCESQSRRFKGLCFSENNCGHVCRTEGFQFGKCRGLRRRCFCTKYC